MTRASTIRFHKTLIVLTGLLAVMALVSACSSSKKSTGGGAGGGGSSSTGGSVSASGTTVHVKDFSFNPASVTVAKGTKVTWIFEDSAKHNVTADDNSFKSKDLKSGDDPYSFTFNTAGSYSYICTIHQYMKGTVTVS